jgi:hypothetical protein
LKSAWNGDRVKLFAIQMVAFKTVFYNVKQKQNNQARGTKISVFHFSNSFVKEKQTTASHVRHHLVPIFLFLSLDFLLGPRFSYRHGEFFSFCFVRKVEAKIHIYKNCCETNIIQKMQFLVDECADEMISGVNVFTKNLANVRY